MQTFKEDRLAQFVRQAQYNQYNYLSKIYNVILLNTSFIFLHASIQL